jgi:hypothetical protein
VQQTRSISVFCIKEIFFNINHISTKC